MAIVPHNIIEDIRARCDIADVITEHGVKLQKSGSSLVGLCPFHKEKTPSFHVSQARQSFHCFGCHTGGDVFRFIMDLEKVDFMTAVRLLARKAGVTIELTEGERRDRADKDRLYEVIEGVAEFYQRALKGAEEAAEARTYTDRRGLSGKAAERFGIGFAPDRSDYLLKWAASKKFEPDLLEKVGVLVRSERDGTWYDRFHGRLMFPIRDELGRVIGFSGRLLPSGKSPAKYVNSPETPLFHKSRILFALDQARKVIVEKHQALLVEGQIDTIRCHLAGLTHTVAAQGTAITEDHARVLKRLTDEVVLVLDGDAAGQKAAIRSAEVLMAAGLNLRLAPLPEGEDPDSLILKQGPDALLSAVSHAGSVIAFQYKMLAGADGLRTDADRLRAAHALLDTIAKAPEAVLRDLFLREAAYLTGLNEEALRADLRRKLGGVAPARPVASLDPAAASAPVTRPPEEVALLELALAHPDCHAFITAHLPASNFQHPLCRRLYELWRTSGADPAWNPMAEAAEDDELVRFIAEVQTAPRAASLNAPGVAERAARDLILRLWKRVLAARRKILQEQMATASGEGLARLEDEVLLLGRHLKALERGWDHALPILELEL